MQAMPWRHGCESSFGRIVCLSGEMRISPREETNSGKSLAAARQGTKSSTCRAATSTAYLSLDNETACAETVPLTRVDVAHRNSDAPQRHCPTSGRFSPRLSAREEEQFQSTFGAAAVAASPFARRFRTPSPRFVRAGRARHHLTMTAIGRTLGVLRILANVPTFLILLLRPVVVRVHGRTALHCLPVVADTR